MISGSKGLSTSQLLDERWNVYLGGLHGEAAVQARSMEFAVLTDRDVLSICKK